MVSGLSQLGKLLRVTSFCACVLEDQVEVILRLEALELRVVVPLIRFHEEFIIVRVTVLVQVQMVAALACLSLCLECVRQKVHRSSAEAFSRRCEVLEHGLEQMIELVWYPVLRWSTTLAAADDSVQASPVTSVSIRLKMVGGIFLCFLVVVDQLLERRVLRLPDELA